MIHKGTPEICTARLCLRKYRLEDAADIYKNYATDKRVTKFLSWEPYEDIAALEEFINNQISNYTEDTYNWVIEYGNQVIGSISVIRTDIKGEVCEIGYCIGYDFWNQGIMAEALLVVIKYLLLDIEYSKVFAKHDVDNPASGRVMQKCHMAYQGRIEEHYLHTDGTHSDALVYSIMKEEFMNSLMPKGIIIFGAAGVGDTTIGRELAKQLNYPHFDLDDYHWRWDTEIPYMVFRSKKERIEHLMRDISKYPHFVMSGSMWSIREAFEPMFELAVFLTAPTEIRAERLRSREIARWGDRVLPGGDMFDEAHRDYLAVARSYETDEPPQMCLIQHEQWAAEMTCPVLRVDATKDIPENVEWIVAQYRFVQNNK